MNNGFNDKPPKRLPAEIKGRSREKRDMKYRVCMKYIHGDSPREIIKDMGLEITERRVWQILQECNDFIAPRIAWDKSRRIWEIQRMIQKAPETSKKDRLELISELRKELEGEKPLIENHTHYVYQWNEENNDKLQPAEVPEGDSRFEG